MDSHIFLAELKAFWRIYVVFLTPIVLLPLLLLVPGKEAACGYGVLIMAIYWVTEALPIAVTALLPIVLFPMLGVMDSGDIAMQYAKETIFTAMGGLIMALAIEKSNLHTRIALKVLRFMGPRPRWLMLGFMLPTWFLSMWISNTAATAMMIPVAESVLQQFKISMQAQSKVASASGRDADQDLEGEQIKAESYQEGQMNFAHDTDYVDAMAETKFDLNEESRFTTATGDINVQINSAAVIDEKETAVDEDDTPTPEAPLTSNGFHDKETEEKFTDICKMLSLAVAYAANTGGTATLTGTAPNLVCAGLAEQIYESHGMKSPITWASWVPFGLPNAALCLIIAWLWLQLFYLGVGVFCCCCGTRKHDPENDTKVRQIVEEEYRKLGNMRFDEYASLFFFIALILLWFARDPGFVKGYAALFIDGYIGDAVPAMFIVVLLFLFPARRPLSAIFCKPKDVPTESVPALMNWPHVSRNLAWGPIFILGGGFALAEAVEESGLSTVIAEAMEIFKPLPPWVIVLLICTIVALLTEVTSNTATTTIVLPILAALADGIGLNPLYLMLPATLAASLAFMLPVATPPNAIVFSYGHLKVIDMVKVGIVQNILCILIVVLGAHTWAMALFNLDEIPWAVNSTSTAL